MKHSCASSRQAKSGSRSSSASLRASVGGGWRSMAGVLLLVCLPQYAPVRGPACRTRGVVSTARPPEGTDASPGGCERSERGGFSSSGRLHKSAHEAALALIGKAHRHLLAG